jgi:hypothetical protein
MLKPSWLGAAAQAALILSGLVVYWTTVSSQVIGAWRGSARER